MAQGRVESDLFVAGNITARSILLPDGCVTNQSVAGGIDYTKVIHKHPVVYRQKNGTAVVTETVLAHIADGDGSIVAVEVVCVVPPTSTDTVTVDIKKGNAGSSYTTVLTAPITLDNTSVTRVVYSGSTATGTYSDGDSFEVVVTASGSSCQGLFVAVWLAEEPA